MPATAVPSGGSGILLRRSAHDRAVQVFFVDLAVGVVIAAVRMTNAERS